MARLQDLLNQDQSGYLSMADLDAIEQMQRGQSLPSLADLAPGTGYIQRTGGERVAVGVPNQAPQAQLDYASPLEIMGAKGYRIKGDPNRALLSDGRMVTLNAGDVAAQQALRQKQDAAQLDMDLKRQQLENAKGGNWKYNADLGVLINDRGETKPMAAAQGGVGQITPGTVEERLAAGYGQRMALADDLMRQIGKEGYQTTGKSLAESVPFIGDYLGRQVASDKQQQFGQAQSDWVRAKLRKESGAAIGKDEMEKEISTYFPQPGDSDAVIAQKAEARKVANDAMKMAAGKAGGAVTGVRHSSSPDQLMKEAQAAIDRGAPREAVMQRLQERLRGQ